MNRTDIRFYQAIKNKRVALNHTGSQETTHTEIYRDVEAIVRELSADGFEVEWAVEGTQLTVSIHEKEAF